MTQETPPNATGLVPRPSRRIRNSSKIKLLPEERFLPALESLLTRGQDYSSITIDVLAAEAGTSRTWFYSHFEDMADLIGRLMTIVDREIAEASASWPGQGATKEDVVDAIRKAAEVYRRNWVIIAGYRYMVATNPPMRSRHLLRMTLFRQYSRSTLSGFLRDGSGDDRAIEAAADAVAWFAMSCFERIEETRNEESFRKMIDGLAFVCLSVMSGVSAKI